ncbi:MAG: hypothetical protein ACOCXT_00025 [Candidatus Dojkabacteria bacterium]
MNPELNLYIDKISCISVSPLKDYIHHLAGTHNTWGHVSFPSAMGDTAVFPRDTEEAQRNRAQILCHLPPNAAEMYRQIVTISATGQLEGNPPGNGAARQLTEPERVLANRIAAGYAPYVAASLIEHEMNTAAKARQILPIISTNDTTTTLGPDEPVTIDHFWQLFGHGYNATRRNSLANELISRCGEQKPIDALLGYVDQLNKNQLSGGTRERALKLLAETNRIECAQTLLLMKAVLEKQREQGFKSLDSKLIATYGDDSDALFHQMEQLANLLRMQNSHNLDYFSLVALREDAGGDTLDFKGKDEYYVIKDFIKQHPVLRNILNKDHFFINNKAPGSYVGLGFSYPIAPITLPDEIYQNIPSLQQLRELLSKGINAFIFLPDSGTEKITNWRRELIIHESGHVATYVANALLDKEYGLPIGATNLLTPRDWQEIFAFTLEILSSDANHYEVIRTDALVDAIRTMGHIRMWQEAQKLIDKEVTADELMRVTDYLTSWYQDTMHSSLNTYDCPRSAGDRVSLLELSRRAYPIAFGVSIYLAEQIRGMTEDDGVRLQKIFKSIAYSPDYQTLLQNLGTSEEELLEFLKKRITILSD